MDESLSIHATRRQFMQGVVAASTGIAASIYVKPNLRALGAPGALAQVSDPPLIPPPADSSQSGSSDPATPATESFPSLPSTGGGGTSTDSSPLSSDAPESSESSVPEIIGLALVGGLIGRRAVDAHRRRREIALVDSGDPPSNHA